MDVTYKVIKSDRFVVSGYEDSKIVYRKTMVVHSKTTKKVVAYRTLMITYPKEQKAKYDSYCKVISKTVF